MLDHAHSLTQKEVAFENQQQLRPIFELPRGWNSSVRFSIPVNREGSRMRHRRSRTTWQSGERPDPAHGPALPLIWYCFKQTVIAWGALFRLCNRRMSTGNFPARFPLLRKKRVRSFKRTITGPVSTPAVMTSWPSFHWTKRYPPPVSCGKRFALCSKDFPSEDGPPTLSVGMVIGHFMEPLEDLRSYALEAEEGCKEAK